MTLAVNHETGEVKALIDGEWQPTSMARNKQTGETLALDGGEWKPVGQKPEQQEEQAQSKLKEDGSGIFSDALHGAGTAAIITTAGRLLSMAPHPAAKAIGMALSSTPALNLAGGATGEAARGFVERRGANEIEQLLTSMAAGLTPYGIAAAVPKMAERAAGNIIRQVKPNKEEALAIKQLGGALQRDKAGVETLKPDQSLLQRAGRGTVSRAETIATREGEAADKIANYAASRQADLPAELSGFLEGSFKEGNFPAIKEEIKRRAMEAAKPGYDNAYSNFPKVSNPEIDKILSRVVRAGDWKVLVGEARKIAAYEGHTLGKIDRSAKAITSFSTKDLDYMTRALRNLGQSTEGAGAFGNRTPLGRMRENAAREIRNIMKAENPDFAKVTGQYADAIALDEAGDLGRQANLFGNSWKDSVAQYKKMSDYEQAMWRLGQSERLQTMIDTNPAAALRRFNSQRFKKAMSEFYPPAELEKLQANLAARAKEYGSMQRVTGNSRTAARAMQQADDAQMAGDIGNLAVDTATGGKSALLRGVTRAVKPKLESVLKVGDKQKKADELLADLITSSRFSLAAKETGGQTSKAVNNALTQLLKTPEGKEALKRALGKRAKTDEGNPLLFLLINSISPKGGGDNYQ